MGASLWQKCLARLEGELPPQQFNTWIRPLHAVEETDILRLLAPNHFVRDWVTENLAEDIADAIRRISGNGAARVVVQVGSRDAPPGACCAGTPRETAPVEPRFGPPRPRAAGNGAGNGAASARLAHRRYQANGLRPGFTFDSFVEGKSNQLARAASMQVAANPGGAYNPLFLYGGVGLGKTHLMHAIGNDILAASAGANVVYLHSERFVADMVSALQHNAISDFKRFYRSVDVLLIDDIQFFAGKERSQEEFFHTFNALLEGQRQVVLTCDRYPKEVDGLEERLKSRVGWGLPVAIEPPELETRAAILMRKAALGNAELPREVAFFIAQKIRSNVRELEGALRRVLASAHFTGRAVTLELAKEALRDVLALQEKAISIDNIQKTVAQFYKIRVSDLLSKRRSRSIARPRQVAMALAKELTNHSLPEIGEAFGGRDHTTVLHACRKIASLRENDPTLDEDFTLLLRTLST